MHQRASLYAASIQARHILPYLGRYIRLPRLLLTTPRFSFTIRHQPFPQIRSNISDYTFTADSRHFWIKSYFLCPFLEGARGLMSASSVFSMIQVQSLRSLIHSLSFTESLSIRLEILSIYYPSSSCGTSLHPSRSYEVVAPMEVIRLRGSPRM